MNAKADTGAMINLILLNAFKHLKGVSLKNILTQLFAFGGSVIKQEGVCCLGIRCGTLITSALFHVVKSKGPILLELRTFWKLGLVTFNFTIKTRIPPSEKPQSHQPGKTCLNPNPAKNETSKTHH